MNRATAPATTTTTPIVIALRHGYSDECENDTVLGAAQ